MFKRHPLTVTFSAFLFTMTCLLFSASTVTAQTLQGAQMRPGGPIRGGIDVKLGKNPGGSAAARRTGVALISRTDENGNFDFGLLPKGEYVLVLSLPDPGTSEKGVLVNTSRGNIRIARMSMAGAVGGKFDKDWSFEADAAMDIPSSERLAGKTDSKAATVNGPGKPVYGNITFQADGKTVVKGTITFQK
jgi:hypothetical protein